MLRRGTGHGSGRDESRERGEGFRDLERALEDVEFPISRDDLIARASDEVALRAPNGETWSLREILTDVPVPAFTSPRHVTEVIQMRWQDFADIYRPGGTAASHAPIETPNPPRDAATERAVDAKADWERERG